jgi:hypothetical protein
MTPYQQLELIRVMTGQRIKLGRYESIRSCKISPTEILIVINRTQYTEGARADKITASGLEALRWLRADDTHAFRADEPLIVWGQPEFDYYQHQKW